GQIIGGREGEVREGRQFELNRQPGQVRVVREVGIGDAGEDLRRDGPGGVAIVVAALVHDYGDIGRSAREIHRIGAATADQSGIEQQFSLVVDRHAVRDAKKVVIHFQGAVGAVQVEE